MEMTLERLRDNAGVLLIPVRDLAERTRAIDIRRYEEAEPVEVVLDIVSICGRFLDEADALLDRVASRFDPGDELAEVAAPAQTAADAAFMARMDLRQRRELLEQLGGAIDRWEIIARSDRCFRSLHRALIAIETELCCVAQKTPTIEPLTSVRMTAQIRLAYMKFQHEVTKHGEPDSSSVYKVLRASGIAMAVMIGRDEYRVMRLNDRRELRELQRRVLDWLANDNRGARDGERLWQDIVSYARLLLQINNRAELIAHDADLIRDLLSRSDRIEFPKNGLIERDLRLLWGRDASLDELFESERWNVTDTLRDALREVAVRLTSAPDSSDEDTRSFDTFAGGESLSCGTVVQSAELLLM